MQNLPQGGPSILIDSWSKIYLFIFSNVIKIFSHSEFDILFRSHLAMIWTNFIELNLLEVGKLKILENILTV